MRTHQHYCDEYLPKLHFAANIIQKNFRGLLSRRNAKSIADAIAAEWSRHRNMQALVIQCAFRYYLARLERCQRRFLRPGGEQGQGGAGVQGEGLERREPVTYALVDKPL